MTISNGNGKHSPKQTTTGMHGKRALVTGATNGIGKATAHALAAMGATVIIGGRNEAKCVATAEEIMHATGNSAVETLQADLSSMQDVRLLAEQFTRRYKTLDVLVNNAGAVFDQRLVTVDGYEMTFALNHLSYFLLTNLLLDTLQRTPGARIVNVASETHHTGQLRLDDLNSERGYRLGGFGVYATSKLANILFTYELARRLRATGVDGSQLAVNAMAPGMVASGFARNNRSIVRALAGVMQRFGRTPEKGAETIVYLASSPEVADVSGKYFEDCRPVATSKASYDEALARQLWEASTALVGLTERV